MMKMVTRDFIEIRDALVVVVAVFASLSQFNCCVSARVRRAYLATWPPGRLLPAAQQRYLQGDPKICPPRTQWTLAGRAVHLERGYWCEKYISEVPVGRFHHLANAMLGSLCLFLFSLNFPH